MLKQNKMRVPFLMLLLISLLIQFFSCESPGNDIEESNENRKECKIDINLDYTTGHISPIWSGTIAIYNTAILIGRDGKIVGKYIQYNSVRGSGYHDIKFRTDSYSGPAFQNILMSVENIEELIFSVKTGKIF